MSAYYPVPEGAWARSAFFLRLAWRLFRGDRALIGVAAMAALLNLVAVALVLGGAEWLLHDIDLRLLLTAAVALLGTASVFISTYCSVALLVMAQARFEGRRLTARQGFAEANRRRRRILAWALVAATVGQLLNLLEQVLPLGGRVLAFGGGVAWSLATMFAIPVLVVEDAGVRDAARRSAAIFRARWGESLIGPLGLGLVTTVIAVPFLVLGVIGLIAGGPLGLLLAAVCGGVVGARATLVRGLDELYRLAIYRHEVLGLGAFDLSPEQLDSFIKIKRRKGR